MTSAPTNYPLHTFFNTSKELDEFNENLQNFMNESNMNIINWHWCGVGSSGKTTLVKQLFPNAVSVATDGHNQIYKHKKNFIIVCIKDEKETDKMKVTYKNTTNVITYFPKNFSNTSTMITPPTTNYPLHTFFNTSKELDEFNENLQKFMKGICVNSFNWYWCGTGSNGKTTLVKQLFPNAIQLSPITTRCKETYNYKDNFIIILIKDEVETERIRESHKSSTNNLVTYFPKKITSAKEKEVSDYILNNMFNKNQHEADIFSNLYKTFKDHKNTSLADWAWIGDVEEMKHHIAVLFEKPFISLNDSSAKECVYLYMYMGVREYIFLQTPEQFTTCPKSMTVSHIPKQQKVAEPVKIPADIDNLILNVFGDYKEIGTKNFKDILEKFYDGEEMWWVWVYKSDFSSIENHARNILSPLGIPNLDKLTKDSIVLHKKSQISFTRSLDASHKQSTYITQINYKEKVAEAFNTILKRQYAERVDYFVKNYDFKQSGHPATFNCQLCFNQRNNELSFQIDGKEICNDCYEIISKKIPKKTVEMTEKEYELFLKFKSQ